MLLLHSLLIRSDLASPRLAVFVSNPFGELTYPVRVSRVLVQLSFTGEQRNIDGSFALDVLGNYGQEYTLQTHTNLQAQPLHQWQDLSRHRHTLSGGTQRVVDPTAHPFQQHFYRLRSPPY